MYSGKPKGAGSVHVISLCCAVTQLLQLLLLTHFVCVLSSHPSHAAFLAGTCPCPGCPSPKLGWCKAKPVLGQTEGHVCSLCCSTDWRALRCLWLDPSAEHCLVSLALTSSLFGPVMLRDLTLGMEVTVFPLTPQNQEYTQVLCGGRTAVNLQDGRTCSFADLRILTAFDFCLLRSRLCLVR